MTFGDLLSISIRGILNDMINRLQQFRVIIEQDEDGFFVASVPELPGCHTQAKTMPELKKRTKEAISLCLEMSRTDRQYQDRARVFAYNRLVAE